MINWFFTTLRTYPEIAIFLALAFGYYFGKFTFKGIGLGAVTATLLAGVVIGQIGITISQPLKATVFLMFLIAVLGPKLLGINLFTACKDYEEKQGGTKELGGAGSAWRRWEVRAFRVAQGGKAVGLRVPEAEALVPDARVFILRIRRDQTIEEATADTVLREGDVVSGPDGGARNRWGLGANEKKLRYPGPRAPPLEGVSVSGVHDAPRLHTQR